MKVIHAAQAGQGGPVTVACINNATVDLGVDFDKLTAALRKCYYKRFLPIWGYPLRHTIVTRPLDCGWWHRLSVRARVPPCDR